MVTIDNEVNTLVAQKYSAVIEMLMLIRVENEYVLSMGTAEEGPVLCL